MSDTEPDVPSGTAQQSPSVMASSSVSTNTMALVRGAGQRIPENTTHGHTSSSAELL